MIISLVYFTLKFLISFINALYSSMNFMNLNTFRPLEIFDFIFSEVYTDQIIFILTQSPYIELLAMHFMYKSIKYQISVKNLSRPLEVIIISDHITKSFNSSLIMLEEMERKLDEHFTNLVYLNQGHIQSFFNLLLFGLQVIVTPFAQI